MKARLGAMMARQRDPFHPQAQPKKGLIGVIVGII